MDIFIRNIIFSASKNDVVEKLALILHTDPFTDFHPQVNFNVHLNRNKSRPWYEHGGTGVLTLPSEEIGRLFLDIYGRRNLPGTSNPTFGIGFEERIMQFLPSNKPLRLDVVNRIRVLPYQDPHVVNERERQEQMLGGGSVQIDRLQFCKECRDGVLSVECETQCANRCRITFEGSRREILVNIRINDKPFIIAIPFSAIKEITTHTTLGEGVLVFLLHHPPSYQQDFEVKQPTISEDAQLDELLGNILGLSMFVDFEQRPRRRLSYLPIEGHERVAPFASLALRFLVRSIGDVEVFRELCTTAGYHRLYKNELQIDRRYLYSELNIFRTHELLRRTDRSIALQMESLIRGLVIDHEEAVQLMPEVLRISNQKGSQFAATVVQKLGLEASSLFEYYDEDEEQTETIEILDLFRRVERMVERQRSLSPPQNIDMDDRICYAYHAEVTPTAIYVEGPFPEQSNRVIRAYGAEHHTSFLRVSFVDEGKLQYRFDREVDGRQFIRDRIGPILSQGLEIAGHRFEFLAYSLSALREHAVWFVEPFYDNIWGRVDAESIIANIGTFDGLPFDEKLMQCPARYAARISQAFTATDAVSVQVDEVVELDDILTADGKYNFTDGVGTMSTDLSKAIRRQLRGSKGRRKSSANSLADFDQIRLGGAKGMISVDYTLRGSVICLRPSMIKFLTPLAEGEQIIEIARAFDRPGPFYLNRPLIMVLEGLGVPYEVFKQYQDEAVEITRRAASSVKDAGILLEKHGLGTSYHMPSILNSIDKLFMESIPDNAFYQRMLDFAINHVLRDLKNHARIPVAGAWTLVGVADVHRYLGPDEIFACVKPINGSRRFLSGPVLITRSPVIHPGDVRVVHAIGQPPAGSPFAIQPLTNSVVFSVQGERPVPSCLGGGDLDGDLYNLLPYSELPEFFPPEGRLHAPASYEPAPKRFLDRQSTMADVAEFFMDYISSDVVGMIATNWLITADQSERGIFDPDCMTLSNLHSDAVDYPKSGQPVPLNKIPKLKHKLRPDWNAPETVGTSSTTFYPSLRAIGRLSRAIDLPIEQIPRRQRGERRQAHINDVEELQGRFNAFDINGARGSDLFTVIERRVQDWGVWTDRQPTDEQTAAIARIFHRYASELKAICVQCKLSHSQSTQLSEAEAVVGTIAQKTSQPRRRRELMSKLREGTDMLVRGIREELEGEETVALGDPLARAWMIWEFAVSQDKTFGAQSFAWVALGAIFDAIKDIENEQEGN